MHRVTQYPCSIVISPFGQVSQLRLQTYAYWRAFPFLGTSDSQCRLRTDGQFLPSVRPSVDRTAAICAPEPSPLALDNAIAASPLLFPFFCPSPLSFLLPALIECRQAGDWLRRREKEGSRPTCCCCCIRKVSNYALKKVGRGNSFRGLLALELHSFPFQPRRNWMPLCSVLCCT